MNEKINWGQVVKFMGAIIAFLIGAGVATGQEVMQFFTAYGYKSILACLVYLVIIIYTSLSYVAAGHREKFSSGTMVFKYYCGPILGKAFDYFTVIFCYMTFVVMVAGASSTLSQQFGLPNLIGGILISVLAGITVIYGLNSLVNVISKIGPILIIFTVIIAVGTLLTSSSHIPEGVALLESGKVTVMKAGSNWFTSGIAYGGCAILLNAAFISQLGTRGKLKDLRYGICLGELITSLTGMVVAFAMLANIADVADAQIPNLVLAEKLFANIFPGIGVVFAFIVFAAIYTTASPLLWTVAFRLAKEKTKRYNIVCIILTFLACVVAFFVPFNTLVNYIYSINGYAGFIMLFFMIIKDVRVATETHRAKAGLVI